MMASESEVSSGVLLTVLILTINSDYSHRNIYASARYLPSSASLIRDQILSSVPELHLESNAQINMNGIVDVFLQTKFTTKRGEFGDICDISSFVSSSAASLSNAVPPPTPNSTAGNFFGLGTIDNIWLCIAPMPLVEKSKRIYIHLGDISKLSLHHSTINKRFSRSAKIPNEFQYLDNKTSLQAASEIVGAIKWGSKKRDTVEDGPRSSLDKSEKRTYGSDTKSEFRTSERIKKNLSTLVVSDVRASSSTKQIESADLMLMDSASQSQSGNRTLKKDMSSFDENDLTIQVFGMRVHEHNKGLVYDEAIIELEADIDATLLLLGKGLTNQTYVQFTSKAEKIGTRCDVSTTAIFQIMNAHDTWAKVDVRLPEMIQPQEVWYLCVKENIDAAALHQGIDKWLTITTYSLWLPIWVQVTALVCLLMLSGLFSGLNLGLMALDKTELKVISNTGTAEERRCAKAIEPVRRHGNFLLCTLLLGNVMVNSTLTILLDTLSTGLIAVIGSTVGIVIFGEIIPQAVCSRHGLAVGAKTVWLVRIFMVLTGIVSWPVSKILDCALGEELGSTYDRERLKELIRVQDCNDIKVEEQNIIYGALELHKKTVSEIMTKLSDVYMLDIDINLDFSTINDIMQQGYSRIPIFEKERTNILSVLFIKDLAFIDPDDNVPLKTISQFYQNVCNFVFEDTTLDVIFKEFKEGSKGHMAFVQQVNSDGDCDPFYEVIGIITLEDVIEELIQEEIVDETDIYTDNKTKRRRKHVGRKDFKEFFTGNVTNSRKIQISPQLQIAAFQFLRTSIEPFKENQLSESILKRMLNQDIIHIVNVTGKDADSTENNLFTQGKPVDYFVLILEGHVQVTIGKENLSFDSGPFSYFGLSALQHNQQIGESPPLSAQISKTSIMGSLQSLDSGKTVFIPDYSVKASTEVIFLKVRRAQYLAAKRAFLLEQNQKDPHAAENFEKEMEKILRSEYLNSPVWEVDLEHSTGKLDGVKDSLLNGVTVRSKSDQDDVELSIFKGVNNRRRSLRDSFNPEPIASLDHRSSSDDEIP